MINLIASGLSDTWSLKARLGYVNPFLKSHVIGIVKSHHLDLSNWPSGHISLEVTLGSNPRL